ncbi:MAG: LysM peptidoglycan-binding domain-containing protein [Armatimonadota bacterium]
MTQEPPEDNSNDPQHGEPVSDGGDAVAEEPDIELNDTDSGAASTEEAPRVIFAKEVIGEVVDHAQSDTSREIGGVLLGTVTHEEDRVVLVEARIPAAHTRAARGNVTFTHDTWAEINEAIDEQYPDMEIVGWYHSHPNFGIFLSSYDMFIHENFFSAPWQIAYVVDPIRGDRGCFVWRKGEIVKLQYEGTYEITHDTDSEETIAEETGRSFTAASEPPPPGNSGGNGWIMGLLGVLVALTVILQVYSLLLLRKVPDEINSTTPQIAGELDAATELTEPPTTPQPSPGEVTDDDEEITLGPGSAHLDPSATELVSDIYRVKAGDTLREISQKYYDTPDNEVIIARLNGLSDDSQLKAGMRLIIPQIPMRQAQEAQDTEQAAPETDPDSE